MRRRLALAVAVLALLAGGTAAALGAGGATAGKATHAHRAGRPSLLSVASTYLGITPTQLRAEMQSGKSLAQVAEATPGHTASGLTAALVTARSAHLSARIATVVNRTGGARRASKKHARASARAVALAYLALTPAELRSKLHAGKSLAEIADATPGHSAAGLVDAIVASVAAHGSATKHPAKATQAARLTRIRKRVSEAVARKHHAPAKPSH